MSVTVYTIQLKRPWMPMEVFGAELKTTKSGASWAIVPRLHGRRFKVGASAFLTTEAAERRRLGLCAKGLQTKTVRVLDRLGHTGFINACASTLPPTVYRTQIPT